jgi:hypothetical protein
MVALMAGRSVARTAERLAAWMADKSVGPMAVLSVAHLAFRTVE